MLKAEEALKEAIVIDRKFYGTNVHPHIAALINNLALVRKEQGKFAEAEVLHLEAFEMKKKMVGPEHRDVAIDLFNLASVARAQNKLTDAESRLRDAIAILRKLGNDDRLLALAIGFLGEVLRDQAKLDEAHQMLSECLAMRRKLLGNDNVEVAYTLLTLATVLDRQGRMAEAEPICRECLAIYEARKPDHWRAFVARSLVGASLLRRRDTPMRNRCCFPATKGANAIAVDRAGNVFVTGYSWDRPGYSDYVTIKYSSSVPPPVNLDFQLLNNELVLSWTNAGFSLQTAPAVTGPFTNFPAATSPYTNPLTAPQQFFRLIGN